MTCQGCEERRKMMKDALHRVVHQAGTIAQEVPKVVARSFDPKGFLARVREGWDTPTGDRPPGKGGES